MGALLKVKLDENIPSRVEPLLRGIGVDVETAQSEGLAGSDDPTLLAACVAEDRILITLDLDFSDMRVHPPGTHRGVWVLRPARQTFAAVSILVQQGIRLAKVERTAGQLWVIDEKNVRIRD